MKFKDITNETEQQNSTWSDGTLSGIVRLYGSEISNAALIACEEVNEAGGVLGRELEIIIVDDGSLPESAVPVAERLIHEFKCSAIIGNLLSNSRISVSTLISEPLKIPYLNFSFYEGSISGRYFFNFAKTSKSAD